MKNDNKPAFKEMVRQSIVESRESVVDTELARAAAVFGTSRDDDDDNVVDDLAKAGARVMPFSRRKKITINDGTFTALVDLTDDANIVKPIPHGETQQPTGERLAISEIAIIVPNNLLPNTYAVLQRLGVRFIRADGKIAMEMPLGKLMDTEIAMANAGANAAAIVEGNQTTIKSPRALSLVGRQTLTVAPGDGVTGVQFFKRPDHTAFTMTAEAAAIDLEVEFSGDKLAVAAGKR